MEGLQSQMDEQKGSLLAVKIAHKKAGGGNASNTAMKDDLKKTATMLRPHINNIVLEIVLGRQADHDPPPAGNSSESAAGDQKRPPSGDQEAGTPKKKKMKMEAPAAQEEDGERPVPGMGDPLQPPPMMDPAPKVERWEESKAENKIVYDELNALLHDSAISSEITEGTYHAIRCGLFSPGFLFDALIEHMGASDDEAEAKVHSVVGRVKAWSQVIAKHHGCTNPGTGKGGKKGGRHRGARSGRGRGATRKW